MDDHDPTDRPDPAAGARAAAPVTGDRAVDDILGELGRGLVGSPADQVRAATEAHRALQGRLTTPAPPSAADPAAGPRPPRDSGG